LLHYSLSHSCLAAMAPVGVQVLNGITYPREVPAPEGVPPGWIGVEQAFGPNSKMAGKTYIRYSTSDGRHKHVSSAKHIFQKHCGDLSIPWEPEFAAYEAAVEAKKVAQKEALGLCDPSEREAMVAVSRARFGELTGPIVLGFPGWRCRWDYLPDSGQVAKTFLAADGREWKILKDLESFLGVRITGGGQRAEDLIALVEAGLVNYEAHAMFAGCSGKAFESQGSYLMDPANPSGAKSETPEERLKRKSDTKADKVAKREKKLSSASGGKNSLRYFRLEVSPIQVDWAGLTTAAEIPKAFVEFKPLLLRRGFEDNLELIAVHGCADGCKFFSRINGIYYRMPTAISERSCYQKLLSNPASTSGVCCDGIYIWWAASERRWQISVRPTVDAACIAYCMDDAERVTDVSQTWEVQHQGTGDFEANDSLKILRDTL